MTVAPGNPAAHHCPTWEDPGGCKCKPQSPHIDRVWWHEPCGGYNDGVWHEGDTCRCRFEVAHSEHVRQFWLIPDTGRTDD